MLSITVKSPSSWNKGKAKEVVQDEVASDSDSDSSTVTSSSDSESDTDSSESEPETKKKPSPEYLRSLLQKARENAAAAEAARNEEEEVLTLDDVEQVPLPKLNPGLLPTPYFEVGTSRGGAATLIRDPEVEEVEAKISYQTTVAPPMPPLELTKSGKPHTNREKKELKRQTAGPDWFDMPAPSEVDLPKLYREVEAMRLRNQLDPKRFYRKDEGEGKGIKGLPKYFAMGKIVATDSPFGARNPENIPRSERKRTLVDELVDDAEAKRYAKRKFNELQDVRGAKGKNTLRAKQALRKPKW